MHESWSTPLPGAIALLGAGVALAAAAAASHTDPPAMAFIGIAALAAIGLGTATLARRPRLSLIDGPVLEVKTLTGTRRFGVDDVERIGVLATRRLVGRSHQLVIDLPDDRLLVFGRWELGEDPSVVADRLLVAGFPHRESTAPD